MHMQMTCKDRNDIIVFKLEDTEEDNELLTKILLLLFLVVLNAFFAASEIALISLNDNKIKLMAESGNKKAKILKGLLDEPSRFLATIQIGITLAGFLASAFAAESFSGELAATIKQSGVPLPEPWLNTLSLIVITIVLSYFTLVFGELVPKRLAMKRADAISMIAAKPLQTLSAITSPFVRFLTFSTNFFVRLLGVDPDENDKAVTEEEIRMMVDVGEEKGTINVAEKQMINNIFEFNNKNVTDVMTHRTDIMALELEATLSDVTAFINTEKYSRIPVYEDTIDNIVGVLHAKDVLRYVTLDGNSEGFNLNHLIRRPYFVPTSKRIDVLMKELQREKTHMAVIFDEYGGTEGIVTLEDLIEEIVGNIFDEDDEEEKEIDEIGEDTYLIMGSVSLDAVKDILRAALPVEEFDTIGGFLVGQLGRMPQKGEKPAVEYKGWLFAVEDVDEKRISKVRVSKAE